MTQNAFISAVARIAGELRTLDLPGAAALHRDALDYLREPWATEARAVEVLTESIRVLIHQANAAGVEHTQIGACHAVRRSRRARNYR